MSDAGDGQWYDLPLPDLAPDQRQQLTDALRREGIPASWGGTTVRVDVAYEARLTSLVEQVRATRPAPPACAPPPAYPAPPPAYLPPPPGAGPVPYPMPPRAPGSGTNSKAILSLVLGILALTSCCGLTAPVGLWAGITARREIREQGGEGDGLAIAGIATSALGVAVLALGLAYLVFVIVLAIASS